MKNADKMIEMLAEACRIAYGAEWEKMNGKEQHDVVMAFLATVAKEGAKAK